MAIKTIDTSKLGNANSSASSDRFQFEEVGQSLAGHLKEKATLKNKTDGSEFMKYTLEVSPGRLVSFTGSYKLNEGLKHADVGNHVTITLTGFVKAKKGRMKEFKIVIDDGVEMPGSSVATKNKAADIVAAARV